MRTPDKSTLAAGGGFFLAILGPVTWSHLAKLATWGEVVDSLVSALVFALLFVLGWVLGRGDREPGTRRALVLGLLAGLLSIALLLGFWLALPRTWRFGLGPWPPFFFNLSVFAALGALSARFAGSGRQLDPA